MGTRQPGAPQRRDADWPSGPGNIVNAVAHEMKRSPQLVSCAVRLYNAAMLLYPRRLRARYADDKGFARY